MWPERPLSSTLLPRTYLTRLILYIRIYIYPRGRVTRLVCTRRLDIYEETKDVVYTFMYTADGRRWRRHTVCRAAVYVYCVLGEIQFRRSRRRWSYRIKPSFPRVRPSLLTGVFPFRGRAATTPYNSAAENT